MIEISPEEIRTRAPAAARNLHITESATAPFTFAELAALLLRRGQPHEAIACSGIAIGDAVALQSPGGDVALSFPLTARMGDPFVGPDVLAVDVARRGSRVASVGLVDTGCDTARLTALIKAVDPTELIIYDCDRASAAELQAYAHIIETHPFLEHVALRLSTFFDDGGSPVPRFAAGWERLVLAVVKHPMATVMGLPLDRTAADAIANHLPRYKYEYICLDKLVGLADAQCEAVFKMSQEGVRDLKLYV